MVKIDIITGFLGSGKTTFIQQYVKYLLEKNNRICIIENDFGAINIDMMLLDHLQSDKCDIEMVIGGDAACHQRRLKTKLISMAMLGYQRIILEPSGIFDVEDLMDLLYESPLDQWYEIGNIITVVDGDVQEETLSNDSKYILTSQLAKAGSIIFSKTQNYSIKQIQQTKESLNHILSLYQCKRRIDKVVDKPWNELTNEDYSMIEKSGYTNYSYIKQRVMYESEYETIFFMNLNKKKSVIEKVIHEILNNEVYGNIIRIKGFIEESGWYAINVTKNEYLLEPVSNGQSVLIIIGENIQKEKIEELLHVSN